MTKMLSLAGIGVLISIGAVSAWLFRGRMAGMFRRVSGLFSRGSTKDKRRNKEEHKEKVEKNDKKNRKKDGKSKTKKKKHEEDVDKRGEHVEVPSVDEETESEVSESVSPKKTKGEKHEKSKSKNSREKAAKVKGKKSEGVTNGESDTLSAGKETSEGGTSHGRGGVNYMVEADHDNDIADIASHKVSTDNVHINARNGKFESEEIQQEQQQHSALVHTQNSEEDKETDPADVHSDDTDVDDVNNISDVDKSSDSSDDGTLIMGKKNKSRKKTKTGAKDVGSNDIIEYTVANKTGLSNSGFTNDDAATIENGFTSEDYVPTQNSMASSVDSTTSTKSDASVGDNVDVAASGDGEVEKPKGKAGLKHILRRKISATLHHMDLDHSDPEFVVSVLAIPTVQTFSSVKKKLKTSSQEWMQGFLDHEGLERLLDCVDTFASRRVTALSDALILIECVECIRAVLNSKIGVSLLVKNPGYSRRLIKAMDTTNAMVKKQVVELLSALCMYSQGGYELAMDALDTFKSMKQMRYRFSLIINELKTCELPPYKTTLMAFINCILCASEDLHDRNRIRNEFIGLNLLDIIPLLRNDNDKELDIQCDVFDDVKHDDDEELAAAFSDGVDINSHRELFDVIFSKVYNTPLSDKFLTILQTLLQIDPDTKISDIQWDLMEHAAQTAVILDDDKANKSFSMDKLLLDKLRVSTDNIHGSLGRTLPVKDSGVQTEINMSSMAGQNINGAGEDVIFNALTSPSSGERIFKNGDIDQYVSKTDPASYNSIGNILPVNGSLGSDYVIATSAVGAFNSSPASNSVVINNVPPPPPLPGMGGPPPPPPPPPLPGMGGPPPPPPLPGMGGPPLPPPLPGMGGPPPPPPLPGMGGPPPPPPLPGMGGPPPPPPLPGMGGPPPPPPPPGMGGPPPPPPPPGMGGPPLPPPPPGIGGPPRPPLLLGSAPAQRQSLHYITTPTPKHKMKTFNWSKIPAQSLNSDDSVWKEVLEMEDQVAVQYDKIEQLFCQKTEDTTKKEEPLKAKANTEVNLLDMKRSMNANIFLKQFKGSHADIIQLIKDGDTVKIGAERLRGLHKILPDKDEIEMIKNYDGDRSKLGNAEKFFSVLSELPGYKIRIEGMLLKDDFRTAIDSLKPNVEVVIRACNKLLEDTSLKGFLRFVLHAGNFINAGGYAGNALGFKVSSLNKLMDTRANKPRVTLLHYLVEEAGKEQDDVLSFADNMSQTLTEASRLTVDSLSSETRQLEGNVKQLKTQVSKSENEIQEYFAGFIKDAENEVNVMQGKLSEIKELTTKLAIHFCEPEKTFKLEECLNTFNTFCQKVKQCIKDNEQRKVQEERTEKRRLENEAMKANKGNKEPKIPQEEDGCIIDNLLKDIRKGFKLRKASIKRSDSQRTPVKLKGNVNSEVNSPESKTANETISEAPEIIPVTGKKEESVC